MPKKAKAKHFRPKSRWKALRIKSRVPSCTFVSAELHELQDGDHTYASYSGYTSHQHENLMPSHDLEYIPTNLNLGLFLDEDSEMEDMSLEFTYPDNDLNVQDSGSFSALLVSSSEISCQGVDDIDKSENVYTDKDDPNVQHSVPFFIEDSFSEGHKMSMSPQRPLSEDKANQMFQDCTRMLNLKLPHHWNAMPGEGTSILILKYSPGSCPVVQCSLYLNHAFEITASWHGKALSRDHTFYEIVQNFDLVKRNATELSDVLCKVVAQFRLFEVCVGVPEQKYKPLWHRDSDCFTDINPFKEMRYLETCRSKKCLYAVPQLRKHCSECAKVKKRFSARSVFKEVNVSPGGRLKTPNKFKAIADMISPEKDDRLRKFPKIVLNLKRLNERLRQQVQSLVLEKSVEVNTDMDTALTDSLLEG